MFNPFDWYWIDNGGRVFSSARIAMVKPDDVGLAAFEASGHIPTNWPEDDTGAQTDDSLNAVLGPYGLSTTGRVRSATGAALISAMTDDQAKAWQAAVGASKLSVQAYWSGAYRDFVPDNNPKLIKLAGAAKIDLKSLFDAALGGS